MAVTNLTIGSAGAINYTVVTDTSADWSSVANSTYFYDKADKLVHYKDATGTILEIFSGSGITVGTTSSTGTDGRVFFQAGGVVQQSDRFTFDNTTATNILQLGSGANAGVSLRTIAPGSTNLDIAFRVRNSADTLDILQVRGDTRIIQNITANSATTYAGFNVAAENTDNYINAVVSGNQPMAVGFRARSGNGGNTISMWTDNGNVSGVGSASSHLWSAAIGYTYFGAMGSNSLGFKFGYGFSTLSNSSGMLGMLIRSGVSTNQSIFTLGTYLGTTTSNPSSTYGGNTLFVANGTAPTATGADAFGLYSADITAGNAAPHFRTENGDIIKLYKNTAVTTPQGIADALTNLGVLTASTIAPSVQSVVSAATVTPVNGNDLVKITAQAAALTLANPTGTWAEGQDLMIRIKDDGLGARAITWDTNYRAIGVTLPATTVLGKTTYVGVIYNSDDGKWDVIGVTTQA